MRYCFDMDGVLCTMPVGVLDYGKAQPRHEVIRRVNALYDDGHEIVLCTARGSGTGRDWESLTRKQLMEWGVHYDELRMGKPPADVYVDDKGVNISDWLKQETP